MKIKKIKSVIELAKHKPGVELFYIDMLTEINHDLLPSDTAWMKKCHPKVYFTSGIYKYNTSTKHAFPKLPSDNFSILSVLLTSHLSVRAFKVSAIDRCKNTGEFYYFDGINEWHPESILFLSESRAKQERRRILNLVTDWVITNDHT